MKICSSGNCDSCHRTSGERFSSATPTTAWGYTLLPHDNLTHHYHHTVCTFTPNRLGKRSQSAIIRRGALIGKELLHISVNTRGQSKLELPSLSPPQLFTFSLSFCCTCTCNITMFKNIYTYTLIFKYKNLLLYYATLVTMGMRGHEIKVIWRMSPCSRTLDDVASLTNTVLLQYSACEKPLRICKICPNRESLRYFFCDT